ANVACLPGARAAPYNSSSNSIPSPMPQSTTYHVPALDCPDELALVERSFRKMRGIGDVAPDYLARNLRVEYDAAQTDAAQILQAIQAAGFRAQLAPPISKAAP